MKKNIVQDVVPPKKSIRNISLSPKKGSLKTVKTTDEPEVQNYRDEDFTRPVPIQAPNPKISDAR